MAQKPIKFHKGPIYLNDEEIQLDSVNTSKGPSRFDTLTIVLAFLSVYMATAGIGSLIWAYITVRGRDQPQPVFYEEFMGNFLVVLALLSISILWSVSTLWLLRKHRIVSPHILTLTYNILIGTCLIYFPVICCRRLYDNWPTIACAYISYPDKDCLPIYSTILETEVVGLAWSFIVALIHLIHVLTRVVAFMVPVMTDGKGCRVRAWQYEQREYLTTATYVFRSLAVTEKDLQATFESKTKKCPSRYRKRLASLAGSNAGCGRSA